MKEPIEITLKIGEDEDIYPDFEVTPENERAMKLLGWARLGKFVMSCAKVVPAKESLDDFFSGHFKEFRESFTGDITGHMEQLQNAIEGHKGLMSKAELDPSLRGNVAEIRVETELSDAFAAEGDTFVQWSTTGHQGDIIGKIANTDTQTVTGHASAANIDAQPKRVLIEVKNHTRAISSGEVSRFEEDMRGHPEMDAGLFVSVSHPSITGKKGLINIEEIDGRPVVYVAQEVQGQKLFIVAWAMLRTLLDKDIRLSSLGMDRQAEMSAMRIKAEVDTYKEYTQKDVERIYNINTQVSQINNATEHIRREAAMLEANIQVNSKNLGRFILAEMYVLQGEVTGNRQPVHWSEAEWVNKWMQTERMTKEVWERHKANLTALNRWLMSFDGISSEWNDQGVVIKQNGTERFTIIALATTLRLIFPKAVVQGANLIEVAEESKAGIKLTPKKDEECEVDFAANLSMTIHPTLILEALRWDPEDDSEEPQNT